MDLAAQSFRKGRLDESFIAHLNPKYATLDLRVRITFNNAEMKPYAVTESIQPRSLHIADISTSDSL